ncbi:hypothetical protein A3860_16880 [Niastella vici]|uniref:Secretion system C-terminal sorting domain-containing protein n=1 Tax=Niastella vici TaxID=1703345 RepID=A0A1V9G3Y6_9BACT|nr:Ig-like domain-containing protein [Niastella vici]OQP65341.1 hypothetical protein A3860_16880 [Niastella vici]
MKRFLLFALFVAVTSIAQAQLEEDFDPEPTGWILDKGAKITPLNGNAIVLTSGAGDNVPSIIGTPSVNKTSNKVKVCLDIWAYETNMNYQIPFPCNPTYMDVLFVYSSVSTFQDAKDPANVIARIDNYVLAQNGGSNCFTFDFPAAVTASDFKVVLSFHADCGQGGFKYVIDNVSISGVALICGGSNCPPVALNDQFNRSNLAETSFSGALFGSNLDYPSGFTVDATGTDNDENDNYNNLQWSVLTQPANGTVTVNSDGTFTITRNSISVTQLIFTYRLSDNGPDNSFATTADNMYDDATVTVNWPPAAPLPVSLVNYTGSRSGNNVTLQWTTTFESNNTGFEIQRSIGNSAYEKVGFVATKADNGNSSTQLAYQFREENLARGNSWYRLVQIDKDGTRTVMPVKGVRGLEELSKVTVYPNPGKSGNMNVLFGSSAIRDIIITDMGGRILKQWNNYHDDNMVIGGLRTGMYMLIITNKATTERLAQKIVVL